jgi:hypothetical protein
LTNFINKSIESNLHFCSTAIAKNDDALATAFTFDLGGGWLSSGRLQRCRRQAGPTLLHFRPLLGKPTSGANAIKLFAAVKVLNEQECLTPGKHFQLS